MRLVRKQSVFASVAVLAVALALAAGPALGGTNDHPTPAVAAAKELGRAFADVAESARPAVVFIQVEARAEPAMAQPGFDLPFLPMPFPRPEAPGPRVGQGSGFVLSADGLVVTNHHVVKDAERVTVRFADGREVPAQVLGSDATTDLAVLRVPGHDLPHLAFADSDALRVGEWVVAIGNPFGLTQTVTAGIVSAKGRNAVGINDLEDFIQTDAAINPGNSGGPLLDLDGKVVGINSAIFSRSGGNVGIGFAVPANLAREIAARLEKDGTVARGWLGVVIQDLTSDLAQAFGDENEHGALVSEVEPDSPAAVAGLLAGDVLTAVDGKPVSNAGALRNAIGLHEPGDTVEVKLRREGLDQTLEVQLGHRPGEAAEVTPEASPHAALGLEVEPLTPAWRERLETDVEEGAVITSVAPGSAAARAGLRPGMIVVSVDRKAVAGPDDLVAAARATKADQRLLLRVIDRGVARWVVLPLS